MSAVRPLVGTVARPLAQPEPRIRLVRTGRAGTRRRPKMFYATVSVLVILGIIIAQILLSIALQSGAYEIASLQGKVKDLGRAYQSASQDIDRLASPQNVARSAESLGMVSNGRPAFLRLSNATITGSLIPAGDTGTLYTEGDMVPNELMAADYAQRDAAAAAAAAQTQHAAATSSASAATTGAPAPTSQSQNVSLPPGLPVPTTH